MISADVATVRPAARLRGELRLPGDKSISHRALILATVADGESHITGAGDGADVRSTAGVMRALGATVEMRPDDDGRNAAYRVESPGADGLVEPTGILDCGNSGTSLRLIAGVLAGLPMTAILDGDASLRGRPVARIIEPLRRMGAVLHGRRHDSLPPLTVVGHTPLQGMDYATPVPSAQVKSAVLLAGLRAAGRTTVRERVATRDHTERMLRARGVPVEWGEGDDGVAVAVEGGTAVQAIDQHVPADVSAAAFWLVAASIHPDAELTLRDVGVNPTRRAVIDILRAMGADIEERPVGPDRPDSQPGVGEPFADLGIVSDDGLPEKIAKAKGKNIKAYFRFEAKKPLLVKVAISPTGISGARPSRRSCIARAPRFWRARFRRKMMAAAATSSASSTSSRTCTTRARSTPAPTRVRTAWAARSTRRRTTSCRARASSRASSCAPSTRDRWRPCARRTTSSSCRPFSSRCSITTGATRSSSRPPSAATR